MSTSEAAEYVAIAEAEAMMELLFFLKQMGVFHVAGSRDTDCAGCLRIPRVLCNANSVINANSIHIDVRKIAYTRGDFGFVLEGMDKNIFALSQN